MRTNGGAQPGAKLSNEEWEQLWADYLERQDVSVEKLCEGAGGGKGVSKQRFYIRFADRLAALKNQAAPGSDNHEGVSELRQGEEVAHLDSTPVGATA